MGKLYASEPLRRINKVEGGILGSKYGYREEVRDHRFRVGLRYCMHISRIKSRGRRTATGKFCIRALSEEEPSLDEGSG
jgi:hypothetical protein